MCTLTWIAARFGFELFCNRDERVTRASAEAPREHAVGGLRALFPVDGEAGGTWIGVNEAGFALVLLNQYPEPSQYPGSGAPEAFTSRGLLVRELLGAPSLAEAERSLAALDLARFRPFLLAGFEPGARARVFRWSDGALASRALADVDRPLVSTPDHPPGLLVERRAHLHALARAAGRLDADVLARFHASHHPEPGPFSTCTHRVYAETVSLTRVRVGASQVELDYAPGPPCRGAAPLRTSLARRAPGAEIAGAR